MKMDLQGMLAQAQKMQEEMERMKDEVAKKTVTAEAGGGMIKVTVNGANQVLAIKIQKDAVDPNDVEMLEDLVVAAVNKALNEVQEIAAKEMDKLNGMLPNIPGLNLPF